MNNSRLNQMAPLTGVVATVLIVLAETLVSTGGYLPPADKIVAALNGSGSRASVGTYLGALSAFFLIWFAGSLRSALHEREGGAGRLSEVAFGGGVAAGLTLAIAFAVASAAIGRAGSPGSISPEGAVTLHDLRSALLGEALPLSLAVLVGASAAASIRTAVFPIWFGWVGVLAALASLSPVGYLGQIAALVWVATVSIWLSARKISATRRAVTRTGEA